MSKILNIRLPASATTTQFSPQDFNQLKEAVNQVVLQLNSTYTPVVSENTLGAMLWSAGGSQSQGAGVQVSEAQPYALFSDDAGQANAGASVENTIRLNTPKFSEGIRVESGSQVHFDYPGKYKINARCQAKNGGSSRQAFNLWLKKGGSNAPMSNLARGLNPGDASVDFTQTVTVRDPDADYFELAWWGESTSIYLESYAARSTPARPATPSVVFTAEFISAEVDSE